MAKRINQTEHNSMVKSVVNHVRADGHSNIKADLEGYDKPELIYWERTKKGYYPDVTSTKSQNYMFEVETDDSINDLHTEDQWKLFSANARANSKKFIVVVPKGSEQQAWQRVRELGIFVDNVWTVG